VEAGLHVATSVSRLTSLLVTNDPGAATSKVVKAAAFGTPVVDEAAFTQLLRDVAPATATVPPPASPASSASSLSRPES
jgi:DNA polymerase-3 subunit epsilon